MWDIWMDKQQSNRATASSLASPLDGLLTNAAGVNKHDRRPTSSVVAHGTASRLAPEPLSKKMVVLFILVSLRSSPFLLLLKWVFLEHVPNVRSLVYYTHTHKYIYIYIERERMNGYFFIVTKVHLCWLLQIHEFSSFVHLVLVSRWMNGNLIDVYFVSMPKVRTFVSFRKFIRFSLDSALLFISNTG
jgi:hypothetical protein